MQKHSETALDTPKKEGTESSFPVKMHLIPDTIPVICEFLVVQNPKEKSQILENQKICDLNVPGAGIEPARIAPLVFETSASTDSAIRAFRIGEAGPREDAGRIRKGSWKCFRSGIPLGC